MAADVQELPAQIVRDTAVGSDLELIKRPRDSRLGGQAGQSREEVIARRITTRLGGAPDGLESQLLQAGREAVGVVEGEGRRTFDILFIPAPRDDARVINADVDVFHRKRARRSGPTRKIQAEEVRFRL